MVAPPPRPGPNPQKTSTSPKTENPLDRPPPIPTTTWTEHPQDRSPPGPSTPRTNLPQDRRHQGPTIDQFRATNKFVPNSPMKDTQFFPIFHEFVRFVPGFPANSVHFSEILPVFCKVIWVKTKWQGVAPEINFADGGFTDVSGSFSGSFCQMLPPQRRIDPVTLFLGRFTHSFGSFSGSFCQMLPPQRRIDPVTLFFDPLSTFSSHFAKCSRPNDVSIRARYFWAIFRNFPLN